MSPMRSLWVGGFAVFGLTLLVTTVARAQIAPKDGCADCHIATPTAPGQAHVLDWDRSPHGRASVGCSACHGGNPGTFERVLAHKGIVGSTNPESPLHRQNVPATCGKCHAGPFVAFQTSRHYELLRTGRYDGPTCITCHGETAGRVLSAKALASQCARCHGPKEVAPRPGRVEATRELYESVGVVREQMKLAQKLIKQVNDKTRRAELTMAYQQAEVPLIRAVDAGHKFVYDDLRENLARAQDRVTALMARMVNR